MCWMQQLHIVLPLLPQHGANILQIDLLFCMDNMILKITAVQWDHVEAASISPTFQMGEIVQYNKEFVAKQVSEYIRLT